MQVSPIIEGPFFLSLEFTLDGVSLAFLSGGRQAQMSCFEYEI
jgi:hypothetical protein